MKASEAVGDIVVMGERAIEALWADVVRDLPTREWAAARGYKTTREIQKMRGCKTERGALKWIKRETNAGRMVAIEVIPAPHKMYRRVKPKAPRAK